MINKIEEIYKTFWVPATSDIATDCNIGKRIDRKQYLLIRLLKNHNNDPKEYSWILADLINLMFFLAFYKKVKFSDLFKIMSYRLINKYNYFKPELCPHKLVNLFDMKVGE